MKLLSLFSGIGAFEKALDNLDIEYEVANYCEIDPYASKAYSLIHGVPESKNLGDITKVDTSKLGKIDMVTYGFPCTDISLAGYQKGFFDEEGKTTRSGLFFEALRIIEDTKPAYTICENVKNLVSKRFKNEFEIVLSSLEKAGYNNYWKVLNAKDFGIPQNRERVFIISIRKDIDDGEFKFPEPEPLELRLKDMLEDEVEDKYYLKKNLQFFIKNSFDMESKGNGFRFEPHVKSNAQIAKTITTMNGTRMDDNFVMDIDSESEKFKFDSTNPEVAAMNKSLEPVRLGNIYGNHFGTGYAGNVWDKESISPTLMTMQGGNRQPMVIEEPRIQRVDIPQTVKVRKYPVDTEKLCKTLREHKNLSNKELAEALNIPLTKVEHWFRQDQFFAIPDEELWFELKRLLNINTDEFDKAIMTFEEKEGVYEKSERHYLSDGIAPTLTSLSGNEKIIDSFKVRKLTPKECFRLMGFDDEDIDVLTRNGISNTQLYKMAGNSIVVDVLEAIFEMLTEEV